MTRDDKIRLLHDTYVAIMAHDPHRGSDFWFALAVHLEERARAMAKYGTVTVPESLLYVCQAYRKERGLE